MRLEASGFAPYLPAGRQIAISLGDDLKRLVFKTADDQAWSWTSQRVSYSLPDADLTEGSLCTSATAELRLRDGHWQSGTVQRDFGTCLEDIQQRGDGRSLYVDGRKPLSVFSLKTDVRIGSILLKKAASRGAAFQ
ncbi:hypothetical protein ACSEQ0_26220 [Pseudomonas aeruginosa]